MEIRSFYLNPQGQLEKDLAPDRIEQVRGAGDGLLWLDVYDPDYAAGPFLAEEMGFHPMAVEDSLGRRHQPARADDFGSHLFLIAHGIDYSSTEEFVETARLCLFISERMVVTLHHVALISVDTVIARLEHDHRPMERSASLLSYTLLDSLHDSILPTLDQLGEAAAGLEEVAIEAPGREVLQQILQLKRSTISIQRTMGPQVRLFNRLSRDEFPQIDPETAVYFRDLQDQIFQLDVINQGVRDTADNALATYLSAIGIKQNETMRVLAIVAAVFLPLSLLAGIYGMNFTNMPELSWGWGYFAVIGIMATVGMSTFYWIFVRQLRWNLRRGREMMRDIKPPIDAVNRVMSPVGTVVGATDTVARNVTGAVTGAINERRPR